MRLVLLLAFAVGHSSDLLSQNFKTLYSFTGTMYGGNPMSGVILISNTLYGTTYAGNGTVYAVNTDGTAFHIVSTFNQYQGRPIGAFVISDNLLTTTADEGVGNGGSIIQVPIDGTNQLPTTWYDFVAAFGDGTRPDGLILSSEVFYGVTRYGGPSGRGRIYAYDGSTAAYLYSFASGDGANPNGSLVLFNGTLFGVTRLGGSWGNGTVYRLNTDGSGFRILHHFGGITNNEGANPLAGLILWGDTLFGTTSSGGVSNTGTIFSVNTNGSAFTTLHSFGGADGSKPAAALNLAGDTLYGTTSYGGSYGWGTVFAMGTDGSGFTTLHDFSGGDSSSPVDKMLLYSNTLYGTTFGDGRLSTGSVFSFWLGVAPPRLTITPSGPNVVLTWPTNGSFFLQTATNLASSAAWNKVSSTAAAVNGQNVVTNPVSETQQFFRLSQ